MQDVALKQTSGNLDNNLSRRNVYVCVLLFSFAQPEDQIKIHHGNT